VCLGVIEEPADDVYARAREPFQGRVPKLSINYEEKFSRAHGNFEGQHTVLGSFIIIIINYYIIIILYYYIVQIMHTIFTIIISYI